MTKFTLICYDSSKGYLNYYSHFADIEINTDDIQAPVGI